MKTRDELKQSFKETRIPMGVFLVRNTKTNDFILGASRNLEGTLNKYRFVLKTSGPHDTLLKNPKIHADYHSLGPDAFEFKVLDVLKPKDEPGWDPTEDLKSLEKIWMDELTGRGWAPY